MKDVLDLLARILISIIFFYEAYDTIFYFKETKEAMAIYGIESHQNFLLYASIFLLILGGTLLLLGYRSGFGAFLLCIYWIPFTFIVHSYWNDPPEQQRVQAILFMKNLAILGGLLMVWVNGSGKYSVKRLFATTRVPQRRR